jgi:GT2 family glycosyltransferase/glycosyltransferase involved in cell wall biosynthesis
MAAPTSQLPVQAGDAPASAQAPSAPSLVAKAARASRAHEWVQACALYLQALRLDPETPGRLNNLILLGRQFQRRPRPDGRLKVGVCGWELSHNAAGRVQMLADLYATYADVVMLGSHFPAWGRALWPPLVPPRYPVHDFVVEDEACFMRQAVELVAANPCDLVHLSKPRAPTLFMGMLYKLIWHARVVMDVDDEELAFVGADEPLGVDEAMRQRGGMPPLQALAGQEWTRIAVGLVRAFDGVTVSNPALQQRYGGTLLRHARDEACFELPEGSRRASLRRFGVEEGKKVVLFFGTPRAHKGLIETANAVAQLPSRDVVFVVAGDFADPALRERLLQVQGCDTRLVGGQPYADIAQVVAMADVCVLLQQQGSLVSEFQVPAKLSDALALGVPVLAQRTPALAEFIDCGAVVEVGPQGLAAELWRMLSDQAVRSRQQAKALNAFRERLSFPVNVQVLRSLSKQAPAQHTGYTWVWPEVAVRAHAGSPQRLEDLLLLGLLAPERPPNAAGVALRQELAPPLEANDLGRQAEGVRTDSVHSGCSAFAVVCHVFYLEIWPELLEVVRRLPPNVQVVVTAPVDIAKTLREQLAVSLPDARVLECANEGMDIVPFLSVLPSLAAQGCKVALKLHTKKGRGEEGARWRRWMLEALGGSMGTIQAAMQAFETDPELALLGPAALYMSVRKLAYENGEELDRVMRALGLRDSNQTEAGFFAGSMFWCRVEKLLPLAQWVRTGHAAAAQTGLIAGAAQIGADSVAAGAVGTDGRIEHALERVIGPAALSGGGKVGLLHPACPEPGAHGLGRAVVVKGTVNQVPVGQGHVGEFLRRLCTLQEDARALRAAGAFFDEAHYRAAAESLLTEDTDLVVHYLTRGVWQGWRPAPESALEVQARDHLRACGVHRDALAFVALLRGNAELLTLLRERPDQAACRYTLERSGLFDEGYYRAQWSSDEPDAIGHYLKLGVYGGLRPHPMFVPLDYWSANQDVMEARVEPFFHYLSVGAAAGRPRCAGAAGGAARSEEPDPLRWMVLNRMKIDWRSLAARTGREPLVSVIIPVLDQPDLTRACLQSLVQTDAGMPFEIICADNGSGPATAQVLAQFSLKHGAKCRVLTLAENHHFALGCNYGFAQARGKWVVFLNNDTTVTEGWLSALVGPLQSPEVMAVQPRLLFPDGTLQCGGVVFSALQDLGYPLYAGLPGNEPCANRPRDLQAVTAACMALRAEDFARSKGFDPEFINGQEDVDLCLRLTAPRGRVCRYEPSATVLHHEGKSARRYAHTPQNRRTFLNRWRGRIRPDDREHYEADGFTVSGYQVDSATNQELGIAIYRPVLSKGRNH